MKCIKCYREIGNNKFCNFCGIMQPIDRDAYESERHEPNTATGNDNHSPLTPQQADNQSLTPPPPSPSDTTGEETAHNHASSQSVNTVPQRPVADNAAATDKLMQCPDCGSMIPTDSAFCPHCRCAFVVPNQQYQRYSRTSVPPASRPRDIQNYQKPQKKGLSGLAVTLVTLLLLGVLGGAAYYFFFYNKVTKLRPDDEVVTFTRKGGEKTVIIDTDAKEIEVAKHPDWVNVTTGDGEITIKCEPMGSYEDREGIIKLKAGDLQAKITVKQSANATYFSLSQDLIRTGHDGDEVVIELDTDGDPSSIYYKIDDPYMCSLTDRTTSGFTVVIDQNIYPYPRECNITLSSGTEERTLTVIQAGRCSYCDGSGKEYCLSCLGEGHTSCSNCSGSGKEYNFSIDDYVECALCNGHGYVNCSECNGCGYYQCEHCNGTGDVFSRE